MTALAMFDHHPEPIIDFAIEVDDLTAECWNWQHNIPQTPGAEALVRRFNKALDFKFLPGGPSQDAMNALRNLADSIEPSLLAALQ